MNRAQVSSVLVALALFLLSLPFDAYRLVGGTFWSGLGVLLFGPFGLLSIGEWAEQPHKLGYLAWLANPCFGLTLLLVLLRQRRLALSVAVLALLLAPLAVLLESAPVDEGGGRRTIAGMGPAFFIWCGALLTMALAAVLTPANDLKPDR
jgi:hypothetical protein